MARKKNTKKVKKESTPGKTVNYWVVFGVVAAIIVAVAAGYVAGTKMQKTGTEKAEVQAYVLKDPVCSVCNESIERAVNALKELKFGEEMTVDEVNVASEEGQRVYQFLVENNIPIVPVILFEGNVEGTEFYKNVDETLKGLSRGQVGAEYMLRKIGDKYVLIPTQILRWTYRIYKPGEGERTIHLYADNVLKESVEPFLYMAGGENVVVKYMGTSEDYAIRIEADEETVKRLAPAFPGTTTEKNAIYVPKTDEVNIELYVMSFCPYGNKAEEMLEDIITAFGDRVRVIPRYIIGKSGEEYSSLHGEQELHQDIREYCVYKDMGFDAWYSFVKAINKECSYRNVDSCWESVAEDVNIDVNAVKQCYDEEYNVVADFLAKDTAESGISASPTMVINGFWQFNPLSTPNLTELICAFMKNPPEDACGKTIVTNPVSGTCG